MRMIGQTIHWACRQGRTNRIPFSEQSVFPRYLARPASRQWKALWNSWFKSDGTSGLDVTMRARIGCHLSAYESRIPRRYDHAWDSIGEVMNAVEGCAASCEPRAEWNIPSSTQSILSLYKPLPVLSHRFACTALPSPSPFSFASSNVKSNPSNSPFSLHSFNNLKNAGAPPP